MKEKAMKKAISIFLSLLLVSCLGLTVFAESENENSQPVSQPAVQSGGMSTGMLVAAIVIMFTGISVFGVLFIKAIKKDKKNH